MLADHGVRLAGARRLVLEQRAQQAGIAIPDALMAQLEKLAG